MAIIIPNKGYLKYDEFSESLSVDLRALDYPSYLQLRYRRQLVRLYMTEDGV